MRATELDGQAREQLLRSFASREGRYHGAEVDNLSMEESGIIATRLVRRIQAKARLSEDKAGALKTGFADAFRRQFTSGAGKSEGEAMWNEELLKVARAHLDAVGVAAFQEAIARAIVPSSMRNDHDKLPFISRRHCSR